MYFKIIELEDLLLHVSYSVDDVLFKDETK